MEDDQERRERLAWTVRRAAASSAERKKAPKIGLLRLKPFPRIDFEDEGKNS